MDCKNQDRESFSKYMLVNARFQFLSRVKTHISIREFRSLQNLSVLQYYHILEETRNFSFLSILHFIFYDLLHSFLF